MLPLDSLEAARRFQPGLEQLKVDAGRDGVQVAVGHSPYDVLVVQPDGVHVKKLGAYTFARSAKEEEVAGTIDGTPEQQPESTAAHIETSARIPSAGEGFEKPPLLWEVVSSLQERFQLFEPDGYVMFLNGMHLGRSAHPGAKLNLKETNGSTVTVESLGGTPVELTRPQLRTIVKMYD